MASSRIKITHDWVGSVDSFADLPSAIVWDGITADVDGMISLYEPMLGVEAYVFWAKGPGVEEREAGLLLLAAAKPIVLQIVCNEVNSEAVQLATMQAMIKVLENTWKYIIVYDDDSMLWASHGYHALPGMQNEDARPNCWCAGIDPKEALDTLRQLRFTLPPVRPHTYPA